MEQSQILENSFKKIAFLILLNLISLTQLVEAGIWAYSDSNGDFVYFDAWLSNTIPNN